MELNEEWLDSYRRLPREELIEDYTENYKEYLVTLSDDHLKRECISGRNRLTRMGITKCVIPDEKIKSGDICLFDFGQAYIQESGYSHLGIVISLYLQKVLVAPLSSNAHAVASARNMKKNGKQHLYTVGKLPGLDKPSVVFLNDCKYVSSSRIIDVKTHLAVESEMFQEIISIIQENMFGSIMIK